MYCAAIDVRALLDQLLELQQCLLHQNTETRTVVDGRPEEEVDEEDEEILSDEAEGSRMKMIEWRTIPPLPRQLGLGREREGEIGS